jgi:hypothetical protein
LTRWFAGENRPPRGIISIVNVIAAASTIPNEVVVDILDLIASVLIAPELVEKLGSTGFSSP